MSVKEKLIGKLPFWQNLTSEEQQIFEQGLSEQNYPQDYYIHSGERDCLGMLYVISGMIRLYIMSEEGREITIYRLSAEEFCILSASCVFQQITFEVFMKAETPTKVLCLNAPTLGKLMANNLYLENFSLKLGMERFSDVMWALEKILFLSMDRRLAHFLLEESDKTGSEVLLLTHEQIASYTGSAREVVSRMLKYFESEGMVGLARGKITLTDRQKLEKLC